MESMIRRRTMSGVADPFDRDELVLLAVPGDQGLGLALVELEADADRVLGVVLSLDHLAEADVAGPVDPRRVATSSSWCRSPSRLASERGAGAPRRWAPRCPEPHRARRRRGARRACSPGGTVRGQPSNTNPRALTSASFRRSATISMIISSESSSPRSMMTLALRPRSDPLRTAHRSMSPVAMWGTT